MRPAKPPSLGWSCDKKLEELRAAFLRAETEGDQNKLTEQIQVRAIEVSPYIPLGQCHVPIGVRTSLNGILHTVVPAFWWGVFSLCLHTGYRRRC
jgi:peptide/nickel transport system substrate-binding protein